MIVKALKNKYGEVQRFVGMTLDGSVFEAFVAPGGSWTVTLTTPQGMMCLLSAGEAGEFIDGETGV